MRIVIDVVFSNGIEAIISTAVRGGVIPPGSMLYCIANGWFAINDYEKAAKAYHMALTCLD